MSTKNELLALLQAQAGGRLSGQEAARRLGVSRAAVWKAVEALREQGIPIEGAPGGGYRLAGGPDVLTEATLSAALTALAAPEALPVPAAPAAPSHHPAVVPPLQVLEETESTNLVAKRWAVDGAPHGSLVVARRQSAGRGRLGRSFASPPGGVYLSVVLRPAPGPVNAGLVTAGVAVAVARAVAELCGIELGIKWVNDLYIGDKKCCGILTEAATGAESGHVEYLVAGIGLNLLTPAEAFTGPAAGVAGSLYPRGAAPVTRAQMAAGIHARLLALFATLPGTAFLQEYRRSSIVLGRPVTVMAAEPYAAVAEAIDDDARLLVRRPDGTREALSTGEISIRL